MPEKSLFKHNIIRATLSRSPHATCCNCFVEHIFLWATDQTIDLQPGPQQRSPADHPADRAGRTTAASSLRSPALTEKTPQTAQPSARRGASPFCWSSQPQRQRSAFVIRKTSTEFMERKRIFPCNDWRGRATAGISRPPRRASARRIQT